MVMQNSRVTNKFVFKHDIAMLKSAGERMLRRIRNPRITFHDPRGVLELRVSAVLRFIGGESAESIARDMPHCSRTILRWVNKVDESGSFEALIDKRNPGRPPHSSFNQRSPD